MANFRNPVTPEEVYNTVEWKAVDRAIRQEFPWIKSLRVEADDINKYSLIFVVFVVDPFMMKNYIGAELQPWIISRLKRKEGEEFPHLYVTTIIDADHKDETEIRDKMQAIMDEVHKSPAIPSHLKLPKDRKLAPGSYTIPADQTIPRDYFIDEQDLWDNLMKIRTTN